MIETPVLNNATRSGDDKDSLLRVFRMFNMSDTGRIDHFELLLALKELGITSCLHTTRRVLDSIDLDKSGAIEFEDFCRFFSRARSEFDVKKLLTQEAVRCLEYKESVESGDPNFSRQYKIPTCQKPAERFIFHKEAVTSVNWIDADTFTSTSLDGFISTWTVHNPSAPLYSFKPFDNVFAPIYCHSSVSENQLTYNILGLGKSQGIVACESQNRTVVWKSCTPVPSDIMTVCTVGECIVAGTKDGQCTLFNLNSPAASSLSTKQGQVIQSVSPVSPTSVAIGYHSGLVDIVDIRSHSIVSQFEGCLGKLNALTTFNAFIFTGGDDFIVRKFDLRKVADPEKFLGHSSGITALKIAHKDQRLLSGSADGSVRVWELRKPVNQSAVKFQDTGSDASMLVCASTRALIGHTQAIKCISVNESEPNGKVITGSLDASINYYS
jgi:WD40 repeat protein